jgi:hypothetical protein
MDWIVPLNAEAPIIRTASYLAFETKEGFNERLAELESFIRKKVAEVFYRRLHVACKQIFAMFDRRKLDKRMQIKCQRGSCSYRCSNRFCDRHLTTDDSRQLSRLENAAFYVTKELVMDERYCIMPTLNPDSTIHVCGADVAIDQYVCPAHMQEMYGDAAATAVDQDVVRVDQDVIQGPCLYMFDLDSYIHDGSRM